MGIAARLDVLTLLFIQGCKRDCASLGRTKQIREGAVARNAILQGLDDTKVLKATYALRGAGSTSQ